VEERFERKGHQFVVLDILVVAGGERIIQHVRHTAIYKPRLERSNVGSSTGRP
jgi:hypothetical protein